MIEKEKRKYQLQEWMKNMKPRDYRLKAQKIGWFLKELFYCMSKK